MGSLTQPLAVLGALVRVSLMTGMQYRANFLADVATGAIRTLSTLGPVLLVYSRTDTIAGWTLPEALLVLALYLLMEGFVGGVIEPNLSMVVEGVREGSLDLILLRPADAQLMISLRTVAPSRLWDLVGGVIVGGWALATLPSLPTPIDVGVAAVLMLSGVAAVYGLWILAICLSFWFVRVDNLRFVLWSAFDTGMWPIPVFQGWIRAVLTYLVPVAVMTSFPAMAITGRWSPALVAQGLAIGVAFLGISRWTWRRALASYTSASS